MRDRNVIVRCECHSPEHMFIFETFEGDSELYFCAHLADIGFWRRLRYAVPYIFGRRSRFGGWAETIIGPAGASEIRELMDRYLQGCEGTEI